MKNLFLVLLALLVWLGTYGQKLKKEDLPSSVITKFTMTYPKVEKVKWSKERGNYEAEFEVNKIEISVVYDSIGITLETETELNVTDLPATVKLYVKQNLNDAKIKEASKIADTYGVVTYEAEVKGADYLFDKDGNFIRKTNEKKDKD